eukprot:360170-Chlamydomonas_euryale.AAC.4
MPAVWLGMVGWSVLPGVLQETGGKGTTREDRCCTCLLACMACAWHVWGVHGACMGRAWGVHGACMGRAWAVHGTYGVCMGVHGACVGRAWGVHGAVCEDRCCTCLLASTCHETLASGRLGKPPPHPDILHTRTHARRQAPWANQTPAPPHPHTRTCSEAGA